MSKLEGKMAPDFALPGSDGKTHRLKDYAGKKLVIYFYPKDDTPGCTKEACGFRDEHAAMKKLGVSVLGISRDPVASHQKFISKYNLPFVLLADEDASVMTAYGAWGEKMMYGKKTIGVIRSTVIIDSSGTIIKHWAKVPKAETHPASVLNELQNLS